MDRRNFLRLNLILASGALSAGCTRALRLWQEEGQEEEQEKGQAEGQIDESSDVARKPSRRILNEVQRANLESAVDLILPTTDTPGALDAGVPDFIELMIADYYYEDERKAFVAGIDQLDIRARDAEGNGFAEASESTRVAILGALEKEGMEAVRPGGGVRPASMGLGVAGMPPSPAFFHALRELVGIGFCTSSLAAEHHFQFSPIHGDYEGCVPAAAAGRIQVM